MKSFDTEADTVERFEYLEKLFKDAAEAELALEEKKQEKRLDNMEDYWNKVKQFALKDFEEESKFEKLKNTEKAKLYAKQLKDTEKLKQKAEKAATAAEKKKAEAEYRLAIKNINALEAEREKIAKKRAEKVYEYEKYLDQKKSREEMGSTVSGTVFGKGKTLSERLQGLKGVFTNDQGNFDFMKGLNGLVAGISNIATQLKGSINSISSAKSTIDTQLQGSKNATKAGSYWDKMSSDITGIAGVSPLVKQDAFAANIRSMVSSGIAFNVEQRAFLETIKDKIAATFDANNPTLRRLIRLQQDDSTAARLGMESALTAFLNNMYETTEYMREVAGNIKSSLEEAESLMGTKSAAAFEYQVQKWMGSYYSVGMSSSSVSGIANALGKLAAGDISGVTDGGYGNLLVMAANQAGISVGDILSKGLTGSDTNSLLRAMTRYLSGIYEETKDSNVVQQQYAKVFGLTASDLVSIKNLNSSDMANISNNNLGYNGMLNRLNSMANGMYSRTSQGELLSNMSSNIMYSMAAGIANNPMLYGLYTVSNMLTDLVGGIDFALPMFMGTGSPQTFNVAELMRTGAMAGGIFNSLASIIGGGGGLSGGQMLKSLGIGTGMTSVNRGTGGGYGVRTSSGATVSESGMQGNANGDDVTSQYYQDSSDTTNKNVAEAKGPDDVELKDVNSNVVEIVNLLSSVISFGKLKVELTNDCIWTKNTTGI